MITKLNDFGGNYRIPAGIQTSDLELAIAEFDLALLKIFFDDETINFFRSNLEKRPVTTLRTGINGLDPWKVMAIPYIASNLKLKIIPRQLDDEEKEVNNYSLIFGRINNYYENLKKKLPSYLTTEAQKIGEVGNVTIYKYANTYFGYFIDADQYLTINSMELYQVNDVNLLQSQILLIGSNLPEKVFLFNQNIKMK